MIYDITSKEYIAGFTKSLSERYSGKIFVSALQKYSRVHKRMLESFCRCQENLPATTLQLAIVNMARDSESYIKLSVYTLCGYFLGIGDRHLDNFHKEELMWYPKHKIHVAKLKLNQYKSTYVMDAMS